MERTVDPPVSSHSRHLARLLSGTPDPAMQRLSSSGRVNLPGGIYGNIFDPSISIPAIPVHTPALTTSTPLSGKNAAKRPRLDTSVLYDGVIKIVVKAGSGEICGEDSQVFYIHKMLLQSKSPYFGALDNFKENDENEVEFQDMCPASFKLFANYLYTEEIPATDRFKDLNTLIEAYVIGDRLMATKFRDLIIDRIQTTCNYKEIGPSILTLLQQHGLDSSRGISRYFIDLIAYKQANMTESFMNQKNMLAQDQEFFHAGGEMVLRLVQRMLEKQRQFPGQSMGSNNVAKMLDPETSSTCCYHEHGKDEKCGG